jgi:hypothetical protein
MWALSLLLLVLWTIAILSVLVTIAEALCRFIRFRSAYKRERRQEVEELYRKVGWK